MHWRNQICVCVSVIRWLGGSLPEAETGDERVPEDQAERAREKQYNISQQVFFKSFRFNPHSHCTTATVKQLIKLQPFFRPRVWAAPAFTSIWAKYGCSHVTPSRRFQSIKSELQKLFYQNPGRVQPWENPCCESVINKIYIMMPRLNVEISSSPRRFSVSSLLVCRSSLPSVGTSSKWDRQ